MSSVVVLATAGFDHKIRFWEASSRACTRTIRYPDSQVNALAISNDKLYIAAAGNPQIRIFDAANANNAQPVASFSHANNATAVGFQHERRWIFSGSEDGTVKVWDLRAPRAQRSYTCASDARYVPYPGYRQPSATSAVNSVVLHPNQVELVSGDQSGRVRIWDLQADKCSAELVPFAPGIDDGDVRASPKPRPVAVRSVAVASDGSRLVAGDNDADVYAWRATSTSSSKTIWEMEHVIEAAHDDASGHTFILKCAISPDAQLLVTTSSDKTAKVWSIERGWALERTLAQHQRWVWDACFSADSAYLVTASSDHSARLWDLHSGSAIRYYSGHTLAVTCCALNDSST
ncbi:hypothetical protein CTAYLR_000849 [Chrysophaeum taylorii]|uniref:Target of rapamycin complex subunit LST8 n=1 Tax=Chrysophaeum taylorii TaxID=2483200 RepID=A0AAD7XNR4_9STRA|nr:hypothetical protein CTAYLR_000849 [Chrysophaeum taylorii]